MSFSTVLTVASWIEEYGPLITLRAGTEKFVVVGRHKAAAEIMEKQGASLVDRPRSIAAGELLGGGMFILFVPAGERFRRLRRLVAIHTHLQPKATKAYEPLQVSYAKNTVIDILNDPYNFQDHVRTYAAATSMQIAYGKTTPTSATDPEVRRATEFTNKVRAASHPGAYLVESIPWLKYLPWYARELRDGCRESRELFTEQLGRVKQELESGDASPSFARYLLENDSLNGLSELEMTYLAGAIFAAGSDTFHEELDAVIGNNRAPAFADEQSLPRLHALISEALRWRPLVPMAYLHEGVSHRTTKEVVFENYRIPAGTTVFGNHWAISRDPDVFPDPDAFKPDRWLDTKGRVREDLKFFVFGFGCVPGQHVANRSVFINTALVLWAFRLTLDRTKLLDDVAFTNGSLPNEQLCTIDFQTRIPEAELRRIMGRDVGET
ncbi:cytochrome P450 [Suillus lakei]|nr:cytochrome P450 [Suillus lakei]